MAVYVPKAVSYIALAVLLLGVLLAYHLRGMYVLTLHKLKPGPDSQDAFLQSLTKQHGSREHLLCLKTQKISFSGKKLEFLPDAWDFATLDWYSKRQEGLEASTVDPGDASTGIEQSYSVPFTPGPFVLFNAMIDVKRQLHKFIGGVPKPLERAKAVPNFVTEFENAIKRDGLTSMAAPVHVLNLLKFKSGSWSYNWYSLGVVMGLFPDLGARLTVAGIAKDGHWDKVAIATYPNISTMLEMVTSQKWSELNKLREEGLEDTMLVLTQTSQ